MTNSSAQITLGRIVGVHGVKGWVKLHSDCRPREAILDYTQFRATRKGRPEQILTLKDGRAQGKGIIAQFAEIPNRDAAMALIGLNLNIYRDEMPEPEEGEIYWADLIGLTVVNRQDQNLGIVKELFETGANDVLVVKNGKTEILIPFVMGMYIESVDFDKNILYVDWESEWSQVSASEVEGKEADEQTKQTVSEEREN